MARYSAANAREAVKLARKMYPNAHDVRAAWADGIAYAEVWPTRFYGFTVSAAELSRAGVVA